MIPDCLSNLYEDYKFTLRWLKQVTERSRRLFPTTKNVCRPSTRWQRRVLVTRSSSYRGIFLSSWRYCISKIVVEGSCATRVSLLMYFRCIFETLGWRGGEGGFLHNIEFIPHFNLWWPFSTVAHSTFVWLLVINILGCIQQRRQAMFQITTSLSFKGNSIKLLNNRQPNNSNINSNNTCFSNRQEYTLNLEHASLICNPPRATKL